MSNTYKQLVFLSDLGTVDAYNGFLKVELLDKCPNLQIIDLTHDVPYSDISLAAYYLKGYLQLKLQDKIILCAVNNYYDAKPKYLVFHKDDHVFIGPDNGIFSLIYEDFEQLEIYNINIDTCPNTSLEGIYAHAVACVSHGLPLNDFATLCNKPLVKMMFRPVITSNTIRATIIHVDHNDNVITNLTYDQFEKARNGRLYEIYYNPHDPVHQIHQHYGEVPVGEVVCFFNHTHHLEIAINQGKAAQSLHLFKNETIQINFYES